MNDAPKTRGQGTAMSYGPRKCPGCGRVTTVYSFKQDGDGSQWYRLNCECWVSVQDWVEQPPIRSSD